MNELAQNDLISHAMWWMEKKVMEGNEKTKKAD